MKIHEYQAAEIFKKAGIPMLDGRVAVELNEAVEAADAMKYPVVLKSQVLVGGRGKAGGIKVVQNRKELERGFAALKGLRIKGYPVEKILIVPAVKIKKEFYVGVTIDQVKGDVVLIASASGGVEIEEIAKKNPQAIKKYYFQRNREVDRDRFREFVEGIFDRPAHRETGAAVFTSLARVFFDYDCSLAEINPLVIDAGDKIRALDAKINFDDNALFRHKDIQELRDARFDDPDELEAREYGLSFVKLEGNVGCIVNGAGLAMGTMDVIKLSGGNPANFLDVGGSSDPKKVFHALEIILRNKNIKGILINIFGGITRCDDIAQGILDAKKAIDMQVPFVVRLIGTNEKEAKELLAKNGIQTFATMREAVEKVVKISKDN